MTQAVRVAVMHSILTIECNRCGKIIATLDGPRIIMDRPGDGVYAEFAAPALIQCHRRIKNPRGQWETCGHNNRIHLPDA